MWWALLLIAFPTPDPHPEHEQWAYSIYQAGRFDTLTQCKDRLDLHYWKTTDKGNEIFVSRAVCLKGDFGFYPLWIP